jgi:uncharacterized heparinase superfamily protein
MAYKMKTNISTTHMKVKGKTKVRSQKFVPVPLCWLDTSHDGLGSNLGLSHLFMKKTYSIPSQKKFFFQKIYELQ